MKRNTWQEYQKEVADDNYYYLRSCIRQNFFPGSERAFVRILREELGRNLYDDPAHTSCTGIGYHSDVVLHDTAPDSRPPRAPTDPYPPEPPKRRQWASARSGQSNW